MTKPRRYDVIRIRKDRETGVWHVRLFRVIDSADHLIARVDRLTWIEACWAARSLTDIYGLEAA